MRRIVVVLSILLAVCVAFGSNLYSVSRDTLDDDRSDDDRSPKATRGGGALDFEYQFGVVDDDGRQRYVAQMPTLSSGDRFVVRIRSTQTTYAYLFVSDSHGGYTLLAPKGDEDAIATSVNGRRWVMLPDEDAVLRLDERDGVERVYVVVANRPVPEVERLASRGEDANVEESWLVSLRERAGGRGRWSRQQSGASVHSIYADGGRSAVAVEDVAFRHQ